MTRSDLFRVRFEELFQKKHMANGLPNPCFILANRTGDAFFYMQKAMAEYVEAVPDDCLKNVLCKMDDWPCWTEATFWYYLSQSVLDIHLKSSEDGVGNPDYFVRVSESREIPLECKHKSYIQSERDIIWVKNSNLLSSHFTPQRQPENCTVSVRLREDRLLSDKHIRYLEKVIQDTAPKVSEQNPSEDIDTNEFYGQIYYGRHIKGTPWFSCPTVQYVSDNPAMDDWLAKIKKQHSHRGGEVPVPVIHIDSGLTMYENLITDLQGTLRKQSTFSVVFVYEGPIIGQIESEGVSVLKKDVIHRNVTADNLLAFLN